jgi:antitoxin YefM
MPSQTSYSQARANLARLCDQVTADRDVVIISRRGSEVVALIAADELASLMETAYLLKSPRNSERLQTALARIRERSSPSESVDQLREEMGIGAKTSRRRRKESLGA